MASYFGTVFDYFCENTNFKGCRLMGIVENHGCDGFQYKISHFLFFDPISVFFALLIACVFIFLIKYYKEYPLRYRHQKQCRGIWLWRLHSIFYGISILFWGAGNSLWVFTGVAQNICFTVRYASLGSSMFLLLAISLVDLHIVPYERIWYVYVFIAFSLLIIFLFLGTFSKTIIVFYGFIIPLVSSVFHLISMLVICFFRHLWKAFFYEIFMIAFLFAATFSELYFNASVCTMSTGYFSGAVFSFMLLAFYRVLSGFFVAELKMAERFDGLFGQKKNIF